MHAFSKNNSLPWANSSNFETSAVGFEIIIHIIKASVSSNYDPTSRKVTRKFSNFQNNLNNSLIVASVSERNTYPNFYSSWI